MTPTDNVILSPTNGLRHHFKNMIFSIRSLIPAFFLVLNLVQVFPQTTIDYKAGYTEGFKKDGVDIQRLVGNVVFFDNSTTMYCDSAYWYPNRDFDAFSNIKIVPKEGNTSITGKTLHYVAVNHVAEISGNVVMVDDSTTLTTQNVFYNLRTGIANYPGKGTIIDGNDHIVSDYGSYNKYTKLAYFNKNVVETNPQGVVLTDSMQYNTAIKTAYFIAPTNMIGTENDSIYCERGSYNTTTGIALLRQNAWMKSKDQIVTSDTLYYEKLTGVGKAYSNTVVVDTTQNILICGDYALYNRIEKTAVVTKSAMMIQVDKKDSLFLHADTIRSGVFVEGTDTFKFIKAYYHVKFFRVDLQGKCDSMFYSFKDSVLQLFRSPVLWTGKTQMTAEHIDLITHNQRIDRMELRKSAFLISQVDTVHFHQIKGRDMTGYFDTHNELYKMLVKGNGQAMYFVFENGDSTDLSGINISESSEIIIYLKNRKPTIITLINSISGTFYPPLELTGNDLYLKDFKWFDKIRPYKPEDIFIWEN